MQILFLSYYRDVKKEKEIINARIYGQSIATSIELSLNESVNTTKLLKDLYYEFGDYFLNYFDRICAGFINDNPAIASLYIAPNGIIRCAYPESIREATLGFDMLKDPAQSERALMAIKTRNVTVAGPHKLVEGGTGFIIRYPIFMDDEFKAFSIVVLDWDQFIMQLLMHISQESSGYKFAVWKSDDAHAVTDEYGFIFKNCVGDVSRIVDIDVNIPSDTWHLSIEPVNGWQKLSDMIFEFLLSTTFVVVAVLSVYLRQLRNAKNIYIAQHDDLTGIYSRTTFLKQLSYLTKNNPETEFTIVAADIVNFKVTNSMYGTEKCDEILKYLAACYKKISLYGLCSRYGGDQFVFVLAGQKSEREVDYIENLANLISKKAPIENLLVKYGISKTQNEEISANLICDRSLLAAKSILHNYEVTVANYEGPVSKKNIKAQLLESSFLNSIKNEDFKVWYQPKFDSLTEKIIGAEALVRWIKADGTVVSPTEFVHVFEEDGLIYRLDLYVFEKVCRQMKFWIDKGYEPFPVSVNISRTSLQHKNVIRRYEKILKTVDIPAKYVPLEITESSSSVDQRIKDLIKDLKEAGFSIHMDDFGTGLSSLESLNFLPFDCIKFDKSLIDYIGTPVGEELLKHMIQLVQFMNLKIIAEGVETQEQMEFLKNLNCTQIQGYYYAPPMSYENFIEFLKKRYINQ